MTQGHGPYDAPIRGAVGKFLALGAAVALAVALSGCVVINGTSTTQPQSMGPVDLTVSACADGSPGCSGSSNFGSLYEVISGTEADVQVLLAVRLPEGSIPSEPLATLTGGGGLPFTRSTSYEAELEALEPAPEGERWWGWVSAAGTYKESSKQGFTATLTASLPRPPDGGPLESPLHWRPVVGGRGVAAAIPAGRPVKCGTTNDDLYTGYSETNEAGASIVCIDSPSPAATRGYVTASFTDFGILGSSVQATPGSTVSAAFVARRSGPVDPATTFSLAASTAVPGGSVSIDRSTVSLGGDATHPVLATIGVPPGTPPGSFPVTLSATAPGKPDRSGAVIVTVPGTPSMPIAIRSASLTHRRFRIGGKAKAGASKRRAPLGTKLKVDLSGAAQLSIQVFRLGKRGRLLGTHRKQLDAGRSQIAIRGRIGKTKLKPGRYRLVLVATADGLSSAAKRLTFTVVKG